MQKEANAFMPEKQKQNLLMPIIANHFAILKHHKKF